MQPAIEEGFALKSVRVFYKKTGRLRFVSHLDMNRFITRILRRTNIPYWYTEGFNSHLYLNFALPLSLGFESSYEIFDLKITNDEYPLEEIKSQLDLVLCPDMEIIKVSKPVQKTSEIASARFNVVFEDTGEMADVLEKALQSGSLYCLKTNKKCINKEVNLSEAIKKYEITNTPCTVLDIVLSAGNQDNLNPVLLLQTIFEQHNQKDCAYKITRTAIYDTLGNLFE